jgi:hypothetical protein
VSPDPAHQYRRYVFGSNLLTSAQTSTPVPDGIDQQQLVDALTVSHDNIYVATQLNVIEYSVATVDEVMETADKMMRSHPNTHRPKSHIIHGKLHFKKSFGVNHTSIPAPSKIFGMKVKCACYRWRHIDTLGLICLYASL